MTYQELYQNIIQKKSYLCVGLDTDPIRIPKHLLSYENPVLEFNRQIIEATAPYCVAYKPNTAFYEASGAAGWSTLEQTMRYISKDHFTIADAKRGDIGNTSKLYARAFFELMNFDSITVAPYMGADSVQPFLEFKNKWVILLALTSNSGSQDFQVLKYEGQRLYETVMKTAHLWGNEEQLMFVVGATQAQDLKNIREIAPENFLLVPGVGAQGGSLEEVSKYGMNSHCGLLVNASRSIIYASEGEDFAEAAGHEARKLQEEMSEYLDKYMPQMS